MRPNLNCSEMSQKGTLPSNSNATVAKHTILFIQTTPDLASRTYMHFASVDEAFDGISHVIFLFLTVALSIGLGLLYEQCHAHTSSPYQITKRSISELQAFFDTFVDLGCLVFTPKIRLQINLLNFLHY